MRKEDRGLLITLYTLVVLKDLGLDPASKQARKMIDRVDKRLVFKRLNNRPFLHGETEPCINGRILGIGSYFKEPNDALANQLLGEQLEDGGWNCEAPQSRRSSFHTTICVLEGLLEYERAGRKSVAVTKARKRAENYLLERRMFRSLRTGEVIDKRWLRFSFPTFWHYDVLRGLDYLRNAGIQPDSRVSDAIETVIERRHQNGRWPLNLLHSEYIPLEMETGSAVQAAGIRCALSQSCVGATTQYSSCDGRRFHMTRRDGCLAVAKAFALSLCLKIIIGLVPKALYGLTLGDVKLLDLDRLKRERMWTSSYFPAILGACTHRAGNLDRTAGSSRWRACQSQRRCHWHRSTTECC